VGSNPAKGDGFLRAIKIVYSLTDLRNILCATQATDAPSRCLGKTPWKRLPKITSTSWVVMEDVQYL
jgi:hypothetical protein